jgi:type 1 glutamine amidotransferase
VHDELYNYDSNPRGKVQVIATLDERLYEGGRMGADHPIAWHHAFGGGRAWYTGLGHTEAIFDQPEFIAQLQRGLAYARGSSDAG